MLILLCLHVRMDDERLQKKKKNLCVSRCSPAVHSTPLSQISGTCFWKPVNPATFLVKYLHEVTAHLAQQLSWRLDRHLLVPVHVLTSYLLLLMLFVSQKCTVTCHHMQKPKVNFSFKKQIFLQPSAPSCN